MAVVLATLGCAVGRFIAGAPPAGARSSAPPPLRATAPGRALLAQRCSGCHVTPDPGSMSAESWQAALERMKRMRLPDSEWDSLAAMTTHETRR
jgi:hypothetical protein